MSDKVIDAETAEAKRLRKEKKRKRKEAKAEKRAQRERKDVQAQEDGEAKRAKKAKKDKGTQSKGLTQTIEDDQRKESSQVDLRSDVEELERSLHAPLPNQQHQEQQQRKEDKSEKGNRREKKAAKKAGKIDDKQADSSPIQRDKKTPSSSKMHTSSISAPGSQQASTSYRNPFSAPVTFGPSEPFYPQSSRFSSRPTSAGINASDFPEGFDFNALNEHIHGQAGPSSSQPSASASSRTTDEVMAALNRHAASSNFQAGSSPSKTSRGRVDIDAALAAMSGMSGSSPSRGRVASTRSKENIAKSKEATIQDAHGLTEKEILSTKMYQPHQIAWLQEEGVLKTVHKGKFAEEEVTKMLSAMEAFCEKQGLSLEDAQALLNTRSSDQASLYAALTTALTASIEGRPLRSVRRFAKEEFNPLAKLGPWTTDQIEKLAAAHRELGPRWTEISKKVGRLPRDCRTRWRDYGGERETATDEVVQTSSKTAWTRAEVEALQSAVESICSAQELSSTSDDTKLPWKEIAVHVPSRTSSQCIRKWDQLKSKVHRQVGPLESLGTWDDRSYRPDRDDAILIARLQAQLPHLPHDSVKAVDWGKVASFPNASSSPSTSVDHLPFARETLSQAFRRLRRKHLPANEDRTSRLGLKAQLRLISQSLLSSSSSAAATTGGPTSTTTVPTTSPAKPPRPRASAGPSTTESREKNRERMRAKRSLKREADEAEPAPLGHGQGQDREDDDDEDGVVDAEGDAAGEGQEGERKRGKKQRNKDKKRMSKKMKITEQREQERQRIDVIDSDEERGAAS